MRLFWSLLSAASVRPAFTMLGQRLLSFSCAVLLCSMRCTHTALLQLPPAGQLTPCCADSKDVSGGLWSLRNWFLRSAIRCTYIFVLALIAALFPCEALAVAALQRQHGAALPSNLIRSMAAV